MADAYAPYRKIFQKHAGWIRARDAIQLGVPEHILYEMAKNGQLIREARGIYHLADSELPGYLDLVQVSLLVPKAIICLISALHFHELTTQIPHEVYVALPQNTGRPRIAQPAIRTFWVSNSLHNAGVDVHMLDGVQVKIYNREKTVADCFKFRNRIGEDIALEALKDYIRQSEIDVHKLLTYAKINRVEKIMTPYLKSLL